MRGDECAGWGMVEPSGVIVGVRVEQSQPYIWARLQYSGGYKAVTRHVPSESGERRARARTARRPPVAPGVQARSVCGDAVQTWGDTGPFCCVS